MSKRNSPFWEDRWKWWADAVVATGLLSQLKQKPADQGKPQEAKIDTSYTSYSPPSTQRRGNDSGAGLVLGIIIVLMLVTVLLNGILSGEVSFDTRALSRPPAPTAIQRERYLEVFDVRTGDVISCVTLPVKNESAVIQHTSARFDASVYL